MAKKVKSTAFVPRAVLATVVTVAVVPGIALSACGEDETGATSEGGYIDIGVAAGGFSVAAVAFGGFTVAAAGFGPVAAGAFGGTAGAGGIGGAGGASGGAGGMGGGGSAKVTPKKQTEETAPAWAQSIVGAPDESKA